MKALLILVTLTLSAAALTGCRAEAAVGDQASSNVSAPW
jgi:hypothetical protein